MQVLQVLQAVKKPIVALDVPSGWDVEKGNINNTFIPAVVGTNEHTIFPMEVFAPVFTFSMLSFTWFTKEMYGEF